MHGELPLFEAYRVKHLAQKGSDRITNAVALCRNCHQCSHRAREQTPAVTADARLKLLDRTEANP
ncbi:MULTISPECIES: HNH endonuclease [Pseudomonas]|uniref:HNH endonuclease n=1 Tax=Pseudomonas TaxID=286 RepID=UPI000B44DFD8|nr:HNH endonuclease [Pseudomonas sp. P9_2]QOY70381.1 HNH endonuclease [Pseudomonas sp. OST1909]